MPTPPTPVATYTSAFNATWPKSISVTTAVGDVLECAAMAGEWGSSSDDFTTPTGGTGLTWALKQSHQLTFNSVLFVWTATAVTAETFNLTVGNGGGSAPGAIQVTRWSGSDGVGATSKGNAGPGSAPSLDLTTGADNSAIVAYFPDWSESSPTGRVWNTINSITPAAGSGELMAQDVTFAATFYGAYWSDAGSAGSKTTGMTTPTQKWVGVAVEIKGTSGGGPAYPVPWLGRRRPVAAPAARRRRQPLIPQTELVSWPRRTYRRPATPRRRSRFLPFVPAQVVQTPPAYPPQWIHTSTRRFARTRRGRIYPNPWPQVVQTPPAWAPTTIARRRRAGLTARRGKYLPVVPTLADSAAARQAVARRGRLVASGRSGQLLWVPPQAITPAYPPQWIRRTDRRFARTRRAELTPVAPEPILFTPITIGLDGGTTATTLDGTSPQPATLDGGTTSTGGIS